MGLGCTHNKNFMLLFQLLIFAIFHLLSALDCNIQRVEKRKQIIKLELKNVAVLNNSLTFLPIVKTQPTK